MRLLRGWREGGVEKMPLSCTNLTAQEELARPEALASDKQRTSWWVVVEEEQGLEEPDGS